MSNLEPTNYMIPRFSFISARHQWLCSNRRGKSAKLVLGIAFYAGNSKFPGTALAITHLHNRLHNNCIGGEIGFGFYVFMWKLAIFFLQTKHVSFSSRLVAD